MQWLEEVLDEYVDNGKFATVVGRGFDMGERQSREDFKGFLREHLMGLKSAYEVLHPEAATDDQGGPEAWNREARAYL